jgi:hypothetical protein
MQELASIVRNRADTGILRHSKWDALLVALSFAHGGALLLAPSIPLVAIGLWWNANTVSHNFIHLPFFRFDRWNRIYSLYLTILLGFPQSLWRDRHLAHHSGRTFKMRVTPEIALEAFLVLAVWMILFAHSPQFFVAVYIPGYAVGLAFCYVHGYFEHVHGTTSHYGALYNAPFFNDGYHVEHHSYPSEHWTRLPEHTIGPVAPSRWPAVLRWIEAANLETLERLAIRWPLLQRFLLKTHERALRQIIHRVRSARTVEIVGGGMYPRTAILFRKLLPEAEITIIDSNAESIQTARTFLNGWSRIQFVHQFFDASHPSAADLVVIPLSFAGDRAALYRNPPCAAVLIHDWIWRKRNESTVVSPWLLKRLNLIC